MAAGYLLSGLVLGLSAGMAPGPLLTLVISETLRHGSRAGVRLALAPLLTDLPIIALTLVAVDGLGRFRFVLGIISLLGGMVILWLAHDCLSFEELPPESDLTATRMNPLGKGVAVNFLSPHPWLFWFSVGAPLLLQAYGESPIGALGFVILFYLCLVGSKLLLARLIGRYRNLLSGQVYQWTMRSLGLLLIVFALVFFRESYVLIRG